MKFESTIITAIIIALFSFGLISFAYYTTINNNPDSTLLSDPVFNETFNSLNSTMGQYQATAEEQLNNTQKEVPTVLSDNLIFQSIIGIKNTFTGIIKVMTNIISTLLFRVLHLNYIILGIIMTIILVSIIFGIWRLIKTGE